VPIVTWDFTRRIDKSVSSKPDQSLRLSDFDFDLPPELIAQEPLPRRDDSRLLLVHPDDEHPTHHRAHDLPELLRPGDLLVVNNSKVFPARLTGKTESGASVEVLLLRPLEAGHWEVLARPARRLTVGRKVVFGDGLLTAEIKSVSSGGKRVVELESRVDFFEAVEQIGITPLPPYIKRDGAEREGQDRQSYQTVYSKERGSIAAPTAGLHFTPELLEALEARGVHRAELTLHVGYGTFQPVRTDEVEEHQMESEKFTIPETTAGAIERVRSEGGRIVAVGTTTVRSLESAADASGKVQHGRRETNLFVYPGFRFRVVDVMLTNFHLPKSSLFLLVSAFGGTKRLRRAYEEAIRERYRFYSYGDCMLIFHAESD
jgi:S-adenosylmethionine:tRNA ribosyltransferase-isomerase